MTGTEDAIYIGTSVLFLFGAPFLLLAVDAFVTDNQPLMWQIIPVGFAITFFCLAVLLLGVWIDR